MSLEVANCPKSLVWQHKLKNDLQGPVVWNSSCSAFSGERNLHQNCIRGAITHLTLGLCGCSRVQGITRCSLVVALVRGFGIDQVSKAGGELPEESTAEVKCLLSLASKLGCVILYPSFQFSISNFLLSILTHPYLGHP